MTCICTVNYLEGAPGVIIDREADCRVHGIKELPVRYHLPSNTYRAVCNDCHQIIADMTYEYVKFSGAPIPLYINHICLPVDP